MSATDTFDPTESRRQRGLAIAALCQISWKGRTWHVPSQTGNGSHQVQFDRQTDAPRCTCPDFEKRDEPCKHIYAVQFVNEGKALGSGFVSGDQAVALMPKAKAPKPTYKQDWPAYNKAQVNEKAKFQILLHDLCQGIAEPPGPLR